MPAWAIALCGAVRGAVNAVAGAVWGTGGSGPPGSDGNPLTPEQAQALFDDMAGQEHIPFAYARDYCFARAHEMRRLIGEQGIECRKTWNISPNAATEDGQPFDDNGYVIPDGALRVEDPRLGTIHWVYHVAPTVAVQTPDGPVRMVIDPSLFDRPVTEAEWRAVQGAGDSTPHETGGEEYRPGIQDDDYARTREELEEARVVLDTWENGIVPPEPDEAWEDGIVPDESTSEDSAVGTG